MLNQSAPKARDSGERYRVLWPSCFVVVCLYFSKSKNLKNLLEIPSECQSIGILSRPHIFVGPDRSTLFAKVTCISR